MEYIVIIILVLWIVSAYLYRTSKFETSLKDLEDELEYKNSLLLKRRIEQPKTKSKVKPKVFVPYTDSTPEVQPQKQLMFISSAEKLAYMKTEQWKQLKSIRLRIAQNKCECCGSTNKLHLHHVNYERLTQELIEDVAILCEECHNKVHSILGYDRTTLYPISTIKD